MPGERGFAGAVSADGSGPLANRPTATGSQSIYYATDDGPGTAWLDEAAGVWAPLAPGEIAEAENNTGTSQTWTTGTLDVTGCTITVPACSRPVWLRAGIGIQQSAAGTGVFTVQINETTSGTTLVGEAVAPLPGTTTNGYMSKEAAIRLGPTTAQRTFKLSVGCIAFSGTPQFAILNGAVSHAFRSWLLAEAK